MTSEQWVQSGHFSRARYNYAKFAYLQYRRLLVAKSARNLIIAMQSLNH